MLLRRWTLTFLILLLGLYLPNPSLSAVMPPLEAPAAGVTSGPDPEDTRDGPAEIYFVFGSDTSSGGIQLQTHSMLFQAGHVALYTAPDGLAARVMDPQYRENLSDWYGNPMQMTWWMQGGSIYEPAANTNFPLSSTMTVHLMKKHHGDAIEQFGDEMTFHYHTWKWTDYAGDGIYYWNQTKSFEESRADFDNTTAQFLVEEDVYAVSFRSGWHYMDNLWQARLDELLPFSMHNDAPARRVHHVEPLHNVYDWSRAPLEFVPFRPSSADYQLSGGSGGWNVRSRYTKSTREPLVREIFSSAAEGQSQVVCIWSHLAESDYPEQFENLVQIIRDVAADYPDVPYRFTTAVDAMQRWLGTDDRTPPELVVEETVRNGSPALRIRTDQDIFQSVPFVGVKDVYERYHVPVAEQIGPRTWEVEMPFERARLAKAAVAVTDSVGNLATQAVQYLPDDLFIDNQDTGYEEVEGNWATVPSTEAEQVWGTDFRRATLNPGDQAAARWSATVETGARYNLFFRTPVFDRQVSDLAVEIRVNGGLVEENSLTEPIRQGQWQYVGTTDLSAGAVVSLGVTARNNGAETVYFAADAIRASALIRDRQLELTTASFTTGERMYFDTTSTRIPLRNLGMEGLTVSDVFSSGGHVEVLNDMPFVVDGMSTRDLVIRFDVPGPRDLRDTLRIVSDDPVHPTRDLPILGRFLDYFLIADNDDPESYAESGTWHYSVAQAYGESSRYALRSAPSASAAFTLPVDRAGLYDLSFIVPRAENSAVRALYLVDVEGTRRDSVIVNQNELSGTWRSLGVYRLEAGSRLTAEVRWSGEDDPGLVLRADAVRLALIGDEIGELVADNEDAGRYEEFGPWSTSTSQAHGSSSRWAPAGSDASALFTIGTERDGLHSIQMIVPETENASRRARYEIRRNGVPMDEVFVDQNDRSGTWRQLGTYLTSAGDEISVEVTHAHAETANRVLRADAIRVMFNSRAATSVHHDEIVSAFELGPNYPNPIDAHVRFDIYAPRPERATVKLYDLLGRLVDVIVDGEIGAGRHSVRFNAAGLSPGVYFCRFEAGGHVETRKWIVAR